jgi:hypothetical protein
MAGPVLRVVVLDKSSASPNRECAKLKSLDKKAINPMQAVSVRRSCT